MAGLYGGFFATSTGAAAAFIGLLFVALSFIENGNTTERVKNWRRIMASSSFAQLVNIFFVSLVGLLPDPRNFALVGCFMALFGLIISVRLLPQTVNYKWTGRRAPTLLGLVTVCIYALQLVTAIWLLYQPSNRRILDYFIFAIILLYAGELARAWEITGVKDNP